MSSLLINRCNNNEHNMIKQFQEQEKSDSYMTEIRIVNVTM